MKVQKVYVSSNFIFLTVSCKRRKQFYHYHVTSGSLLFRNILVRWKNIFFKNFYLLRYFYLTSHSFFINKNSAILKFQINLPYTLIKYTCSFMLIIGISKTLKKKYQSTNLVKSHNNRLISHMLDFKSITILL